MQWVRAHALVLFLLFVFVGALSWWYFGEEVLQEDKQETACVETVALPLGATLGPITLPPRTAPEGYALYRNEAFRFSLFYPTRLTPKEYEEASDGFTVAFSGEEEADGFQVFVVPYAEETVTETRFQKDVRTGFKRNEQVQAVDGVCGVSFFSRSLLMGRTQEVWVIHNGFLYEITTYREKDVLIEEVLESFKFL